MQRCIEAVYFCICIYIYIYIYRKRASAWPPPCLEVLYAGICFVVMYLPDKKYIRKNVLNYFEKTANMRDARMSMFAAVSRRDLCSGA